MIVRKANTDDNQRLLALTKKAPMKGSLQLRIDRDPDFFEILRRRGDYQTFVIEDKDQIIASWSIVAHQVYVNGSRITLNYLRDLKLDPEYHGSLAIYRLFTYVTDAQRKEKADLHFTIVLQGNEKVIGMFGGRAGLTKFEFINRFHLNFFILTSRRVNVNNQHLVEDPDLSTLSGYYNGFYKYYQLGPVISPEHLQDKRNLVIKQGNEIVAAVTLEDPNEYRKTVVIRYSWFIKSIVVLSRGLSKMGLMAKLPLEGDILKVLYIKYIAYSNQAHGVRKLILHILSGVYEEGYHLVCLGYDQNDPLKKMIKGILRLRITVLGFATSLQGTGGLIEALKKGVLFEDHPLT